MGPGFQHSHVLLDGIFHREQQAQQQIVGQIVLVHGKEGNNIANLAIDANGYTGIYLSSDLLSLTFYEGEKNVRQLLDV